MLFAEFAHRAHPAHQLPPDFRRIVDNDGQAARGFLAQRAADEPQDVFEVGCAGARPGQHHRKRLLPIGRIQQDAHQVQDLFGGAGAARINDDAVGHAHERLEALLDVGHDHELVDYRVGRLGGNDAGLGHADVATVLDSLLGVSDGGALHGAFHRPGTAAGAHVQTPQAHLVANVLGVFVFVVADRVAAPAYDEVGARLVVEHTSVAQHMEHGVGGRRRVLKIELAALQDFVGDEDDVAQYREQMLLDAADHLSVDEGRSRCVVDLQLDAPRLADDLHLEIAIAVENLLGVVGVRAAVEHGQRAFAEQRIQTTLARVQQLFDLRLREILEAAARADARVDEFGNDQTAIHATGLLTL